MAADLGLVPHAAQTQTDELTAGGPGDAAAQGGLAHAGRAHQAEDGAAQVVLQLAGGQIFQNALLGLLQTVMVLLQYFLRLDDVQVFLALFIPGQGEQGVQIVGDYHGLGHHGGHLFQSLQLLLHPFHGVFRQMGLFRLAAVFLHLGAAVFTVAQLGLDGPHLLPKIVVLLALFHLLAGAVGDDLLDLHDLGLPFQQTDELFDAAGHVGGFQQALPIVGGELEIGSHRVGQLSRGFDVGDGRHHVGTDALGAFGIFLKAASEQTGISRQLRAVGAGFFPQGLHFGQEKGLFL